MSCPAKLFIHGAGDKKEQCTNARKIKRIMNIYHESWDIMIIKDNGTHLFPDNTLEILINPLRSS
jgi:hypothetical protein